MSVPSTETENQLMGEARDAVVDRAQNLASDAASQVSEAVGSMQQAAGPGQAADTVTGTSPADSSFSAGPAESTRPGSPSPRRGRTPTQS
jgi:hypothetical protein